MYKLWLYAFYVLLYCINIFYSIGCTLQTISTIIEKNNVKLFKMIVKTSIINKDVDFIRHQQAILEYYCPSNKAFMEQAFKYNAYDIFLYLLSFDDIILHADSKHLHGHPCPYTANGKKYAKEWIARSIEPLSLKIKLLQSLINHKNFDENNFIQTYHETMLQYALKHISYIKKGNYKYTCNKDGGNTYERKRRATIDLLLNGPNCDQAINHIDFDHNRTALHIATIAMDVQTVEKLLKIKNIDCNIRDRDGYTPLMLACQLPNSDDYVSLSKSEMEINQDLQNAMVTLFLANDTCDVLSRKDFKGYVFLFVQV